MPWKQGFTEAFWIDPGFGLAGWPDQNAPDEDPELREAVVVKRDRIGFRYERVVQLDDWVSQQEAAQLLGLPVMTVNRWVRAKKIPSTKRNGFSVVRLGDVLRVGKERQRPLELRGKLMIYGERLEQHWIPTNGEDNAELDEAGT